VDDAEAEAAAAERGETDAGVRPRYREKDLGVRPRYGEKAIQTIFSLIFPLLAAPTPG
jgi:hypothetical protein